MAEWDEELADAFAYWWARDWAELIDIIDAGEDDGLEALWERS